MATLLENYFAVKESVRRAAEDAGRDPAGVRLLAVSKTFPAADIREVYEGAGQVAFGENRVQELKEKAPVLPKEIQWHLIGHLQQNKVRAALEHAQWIHGIDTPKLFFRIQEVAAEMQAAPKLLLEVNVSGEESKFGFPPQSAREFAGTLSACGTLPAPLVGFMTMAPLDADGDCLKRTFAGLRSLRDAIQDILGTPLPELSMGMSGDYPAAIREGATIVRIGTAIFGHRSCR